jgi:hypothetical protein
MRLQLLTHFLHFLFILHYLSSLFLLNLGKLLDLNAVSVGFLGGVQLVGLVFLSDLVVVTLCALLLADESLLEVVSKLLAIPLQLGVLFFQTTELNSQIVDFFRFSCT